MQLVSNGPDIPERLLQAHEDGCVVLFCGAGISRPAGLPNFAELVTRVYEDLGVTPDVEQRAAIRAKQYDRAIGLLESAVVGGRQIVRDRLAQILTPNLKAPNAITTHTALLTLSRHREGRTQLVTTNYDRLFEHAIISSSNDIDRFQASALPVVKGRWDGLVYLHGLLPEEPTGQNLDHLVLSSGDFGLAYLTERWAARFVGDLFRNYTVCFVGYSIDDPVLRYMTDALAADRLLGEAPREMFAFVNHSRGKELERGTEWGAKNVTPILYREHRRHWYLHETLRKWADIYRDGVSSKEAIVARYAGLSPQASTGQDDFVGRVLWALSDPSGLPAKRFADLDPVPSLEWLQPLCEDCYGQADLCRFGVSSQPDEEELPPFSLMHRPSPHTHAPPMGLIDTSAAVSVPAGSQWDTIMHHLARWLTRHLDDPALLLWFAKRGGRLHHEFADLVEWRLQNLDGIERDDKADELSRIRRAAPRSIPRPAMRTLWRLLLSGRVGMERRLSLNILLWLGRFERDGLTATLRLELRDMLTPRVSLREPFPLSGLQDDTGDPKRPSDLVDWDVVLSSDDVHSALDRLRRSPRWPEALPDLLDDASALLHDAMDLMRDLGGADEVSDLSYVHQPSISDHQQNQRFRDWTALIELNRDAWLETANVQPNRARLTAETWILKPYPIFRRLTFFAAAQRSIIPPERGLSWLLADDHWWLWSSETQGEAIRLLVALMPYLATVQKAKLENAILSGPPRDMYRDDIDVDDWTELVEREVWLRLVKIDEVGESLGPHAEAKLGELATRHPEWQLAEDDELPFRLVHGPMRTTTGPLPRRRREMVEWLKQHPEIDRWQDDDWRQRCRDDFPTTACALCALARDGSWPADRWREALQAWSEEQFLKRSWRYVGPIVATGPDDLLQAISHSAAGWLRDAAKTLEPDESLLFGLCRRFLALDYRDDADEGADDPVFRALNHPVGYVVDALLSWWYRRNPEDGQGLPEISKAVFTELCDAQVGKFRHGRVMLASHTVSLFRVDSEWATRYLLPLFDWQSSSDEARAAWEGFLRSPRLHRSLMEAIKTPFLDAARHYEAFGEHGERRYPALLTFAALYRSDIFARQELAEATGALPTTGLVYAASALARELEGVGEKRPEFWKNRALWYFQKIWPKSLDHRAPAISEALGIVCIAAGDAFPNAVVELRHWLQPPRFSGHLIHRLKDAELCSKFPEPALDFLDCVTAESQSLANDLRDCLDQIGTAEPSLESDPRFQRLRELLRRSE